MLTICCEKCGAGVSVDPEAMPHKIKCPQCHSRVTVPAGLAALPSPKVPGGPMASASPGHAAMGAESPGGESDTAVVMTRFLPWLSSACLHGAGILMLVLLIQPAPAEEATRSVQPPDVKIEPLADAPKTAVESQKLEFGPPSTENRAAVKTEAKPRGRSGKVGYYGDSNDRTVGRGVGDTNKVGKMPVFGGGSGGGGGANGNDDFGMPGGGNGGGGGGDFFGPPEGDGRAGNVKYICYVIDHSGSVLPAFDEIIEELMNSIGGLADTQDFHVVFFAKDAFEENPTRRLVAATEANKRDALSFLKKIVASGYGSSPIPALDAAFKAMQSLPNEAGKNKLMYVLTDGDFDTTAFKYKGLVGNDAVIAWLRDHNTDKMIHVYPIILGDKPAKETEDSMRKIASENGGEYRYVERRQ
ncbi:MAG: VWA domain-containing protein [Planctomycetota bacterium]|nr:VWA domain-containing protein [Planctomycetota bacterium]